MGGGNIFLKAQTDFLIEKKNCIIKITKSIKIHWIIKTKYQTVQNQTRTLRFWTLLRAIFLHQTKVDIQAIGHVKLKSKQLYIFRQ